MRGGAIAILAWGTLNLILFIGNTIWNGKLVDSLVSGFAALAIFLLGAALIAVGGRRALTPGPPEPTTRPQPLVTASIGAVVAGLSVACILFGFVFGSFLIYFGAGMLVLALGRLALELRAERATLREVERRGLP